MHAPNSVYTSDLLEVFLALRELLARNPCAIAFGAETLAALLYVERCLAYRPEVPDVEIVLDPLRVERGLQTTAKEVEA
jgi:hypothetical protein